MGFDMRSEALRSLLLVRCGDLADDCCDWSVVEHARHVAQVDGDCPIAAAIQPLLADNPPEAATDAGWLALQAYATTQPGDRVWVDGGGWQVVDELVPVLVSGCAFVSGWCPAPHLRRGMARTSVRRDGLRRIDASPLNRPAQVADGAAKPRRRLNWHRFGTDEPRTVLDARARIRFTSGHPKRSYDDWPQNQITATIETQAGPAYGDPSVTMAGFSARMGFDYRSGQGLARLEVQFDGSRADAVEHAIRLAEEWAHRFMGPGWSALTVDDARLPWPPPSLPDAAK